MRWAPILLAVGVVVLAACAPVSPPSSSAGQRLATSSSAPISVPSSSGPVSSAVRPSGDPAPLPSAAASGSISPRVARLSLRLPAPLSRAVALAFGKTILVCGGLTASGATTGTILELAVGSHAVVRGGALAGPVHDAGGAVLNGVGYVFGGGRFGPGALVQQVEPVGTATMVGQLPAIRADLAAVVVGNELVVVGGGTPASPDRAVLATTDGRRYTVIAHLLIGVRYPAVAAIGGLIYVIGGATPGGDTSAIQVIDPATGRVRIWGHLARPLSHGSAFVLADELLVAGGRAGGRAQNAIVRLDLASRTVRPVGRLPYAVSDAASAVVNGVAYLIGGEGSTTLDSIVAISMP